MNTRASLLLVGTAGFILALDTALAIPSGSLSFPIVGPTNALWDLTTITNLEQFHMSVAKTNLSGGSLAGPELDFANPFTQDGRGKLHGLGTNNAVWTSGGGSSTTNFPGRTTTTGSISSLKGVATVSFRAAVTGRAFLDAAQRNVSAWATYSLKLNAPFNQLTGHASFYASVAGKGSVSISGGFLPEPLPPSLGDGSWTLRLEFNAPVLNQLSGKATATLSTGQVYPFNFTGSYTPLTSVSKLSLAGTGNALGSSLQLTLDSGNNISRMVGTVSGQSINLGSGLIGRSVSAQAPVITRLDPKGQLIWSGGFDNSAGHIARVDFTTNFNVGSWSSVFYDLVSTNILPPAPWGPVVYHPPTSTLRTNPLPPLTQPAGFYRVVFQTNVPDPSLLVHLSFNNDYRSGILLDASGHGYNAFRYATNRWPSLVTGPDGSQAAEFHLYADGTTWGSGDYAGIPGYPALTNLPQATIAVWAHYYQAAGGNWANDKTATLLDASWADTPGSWLIGRQFWSATTFYIYTDVNSGVQALGFPDDASATGGDTGGWHYYVVTFDGPGSMLKAYFDGKPCSSFSALNNAKAMRVAGQSHYIAIGTWAHDGSPQFGDDAYPNCCWMNGALDDIRIYNRVLSDAQVLALYNTFDNSPPSVPGGLWARTASSSQVELRWQPSSDSFYVAGYTVRRNGAIVGTASGPFYADTGLSPATPYSYTIEAFDGAGNRSAQSLAVSTNTPPTGSPVEIVSDDADGAPWTQIQGTWNVVSGPSCWGGSCHGGTLSGGALSISYTPVLPTPGDYGVYLWYGGALLGGPNYVYAQNAPVDIIHNGTTNTVYVNEQQGYLAWAYLGTFTFSGTTNESVVVRSTATESPGAVIGDAVKFTQ